MTYISHKKYIGGQVMLTVVVFFLFLSIAVVLGIVNPIMKQVGIAEDNLKSTASYYTAESALEDVHHRLQNGMQVADSETLDLNGGQTTITTTNTVAGRQVVAVANVNSNIRKLQIVMARGAGVVFKYGTQSGQGGMYFGNNSFLTGSLYANGDIIGENGSYITGDAFVAGENGLIHNVDVGQNGAGNAYANTVRNSTVAGTIYCNIGSGNNKACITPEELPEPIPFPISDEEITGWQEDALVGGTIVGNTTISTPTTLGPTKIEGDLIVNSTLTISNTLWVTGNIHININSSVRLAPSFGASSGIIVADGYIKIANNVVFVNSGTAGSYILLLSNSTCDSSMTGAPCNGTDAIDVGNNSNIIIANAQKGTISFRNNAGVKEAVGNKIHLSNNSSVQYGTGIFNVNFSSGPSGGYNILDWGEVE